MAIADKIVLTKRNWIVDERGGFLKILNGHEKFLPAFSSEFYVTTALPGKAKGGHYHNIADEWFTLVKGECELLLKDMSTGEELSVAMSAADPLTVFVPAGIGHLFVNKGESEFILCAYSSILYDPADTVPIEF